MVRVAIAAAVLGAALAGCSREEEPAIPAACRSGEADVRAALQGVPGEVSLDGTRLSECISKASDPADIQAVGGVYLAVAEDLALTARHDPESSEARQLGYLVGAVRRGAGETPGFHFDLVKRIEQEARLAEARSAAYAEGERAGRESG